MYSRMRRKTFEVILVVSSTLREVADGWPAGLLSRPFFSLGFAGCLSLATVALRVRPMSWYVARKKAGNCS